MGICLQYDDFFIWYWFFLPNNNFIFRIVAKILIISKFFFSLIHNCFFIADEKYLNIKYRLDEIANVRKILYSHPIIKFI